MQGLTSEEVARLTAEGQCNTAPPGSSRTFGQILRENTFTLFNLINLILGSLVFITGSYRNMLFLAIAVTNTAIGTFQEYRAKRLLDKLRLLTAPLAQVVRDGEEREIEVTQVVLGDVMLLTPGRQVPADGEVIESMSCDLNEALLTGESEPVRKDPGDTALSGSFVQAGRAWARVTHVGADSYANSLAEQSRVYKRATSGLRDALNKILKLVSFIIFPLGGALFATQVLFSRQPWREAVLNATAGMLGMVPEGLLLLCSVSLAVGAIKLAQRRTLVQQMSGIEMLARVDTLCIDKTGTLTEGALTVGRMDSAPGLGEGRAKELLGRLIYAFPDHNATAAALASFTGEPEGEGWDVENTVPFSSVYKWSGVHFRERGSLVLGAPEVVTPGIQPPEWTVAAGEGERTLVLAHTKEGLPDKGLPPSLSPLAYFYICDRVREGAPATLDYFVSQGVEIRVISGDGAQTVCAVAKEAGVRGAERALSAESLPEDEEELRRLVSDTIVFGRVTPTDKKRIIAALQKEGRTVAMTGDGVNDVLALKQADCSIAMASGSEAARGVAEIVLLDSDFGRLPKVVAEGRRVINNIERVSSMFLVKTLYSFLMTVIFVLFMHPYPFAPIHQTLIGAMTVGIPSFFLALEPSHDRVREGFVHRALLVALPAALTVTGLIMLSYGIIVPFGLPYEDLRLICPALTGIIGLQTIYRLSRPLTALRTVLLTAMSLGFLTGLYFFGDLFLLAPVTPWNALYIACCAVAAYPAASGIRWICGKVVRARDGSKDVAA